MNDELILWWVYVDVDVLTKQRPHFHKPRRYLHIYNMLQIFASSFDNEGVIVSISASQTNLFFSREVLLDTESLIPTTPIEGSFNR